jgi:hypothetical protein
MKYLLAIFATLVALFALFTYPIAYRWYIKTYFPAESSVGPFTSFMASVLILCGLLVVCVVAWNRAIDQK